MPSKKFIKSRVEMEKILREERVGFLGLSVNGTPYVIPLNYGYIEGKILFHCGLKGQKLDWIRANPQVCFTVGRQSGEVCPHPCGPYCPTDTDSVICYGIARIIEDMEERWRVMNVFNRCFQPNAREISKKDVSKCFAVEIEITKMTGRQQRKGIEWTYFEYNFH
jgi:nitroimidazol reductase NimA-like FMN-containing flavoprotein (pyridoxamine 5'-phosphate oxidase superfamily)